MCILFFKGGKVIMEFGFEFLYFASSNILHMVGWNDNTESLVSPRVIQLTMDFGWVHFGFTQTFSILFSQSFRFSSKLVEFFHSGLLWMAVSNMNDLDNSITNSLNVFYLFAKCNYILCFIHKSCWFVSLNPINLVQFTDPCFMIQSKLLDEN